MTFPLSPFPVRRPTFGGGGGGGSDVTAPVARGSLQETSNATTHTTTITSPTNGRSLYAVVFTGQGQTFSNVTSGWTKVINETACGDGQTFAVFRKVSNGAESSFAFDSSSNTTARVSIFEVMNDSGVAALGSGSANGNTGFVSNIVTSSVTGVAGSVLVNCFASYATGDITSTPPTGNTLIHKLWDSGDRAVQISYEQLASGGATTARTVTAGGASFHGWLALQILKA